MAACDNLYGNRKEWNELHAFLVQNNANWIKKYMHPQPTEEDGEVRICYIANIQDFLIKNCPLEWVQQRLNENFTIQRFICGKAHHE